MGNYLKMPDKRRVLALLELGWSYRRIERETGVRRETVARYDPRRPGLKSRAQDRDPALARGVFSFGPDFRRTPCSATAEGRNSPLSMTETSIACNTVTC